MKNMKRLLFLAPLALVISIITYLAWLNYHRWPPANTDNFYVCPVGSVICDYDGHLVAVDAVGPDAGCHDAKRPCASWDDVMRQFEGKTLDHHITINLGKGMYMVPMPVVTYSCDGPKNKTSCEYIDSAQKDYVIIPQPGPSAFTSEQTYAEWRAQNMCATCARLDWGTTRSYGPDEPAVVFEK